uniref:Serine/threonine protein kinase n=1 Tax=uncultured Planctomycetota bacterium TaxID=120965 RepID=H5SIK3_9BACT|nr:serine/threonine protein kinase [uncultured Planctomycetota bacterium]
MTDSGCPSSEWLQAFAEGKLAGRAYEEVAAHVERCASCQDRLDEHKPTPDGLMAALQQLGKTNLTPPWALPNPGDDADKVSRADPTLPGSDPEMPAPEGFELVEVIAQGGMGVVWLARDTQLGRYVAIKTLLPSKRQRADLLERFLEEARLTAQLQHPGIPPVYQMGVWADGRPFLVMKLVRGQTLQQLLRSRTDPRDRWAFFLQVFEQVCQAVGYAHSHRVIHRDLKPGNIMVGSHGEVQVMDWGLAKVLGDVATPVQVAAARAEATMTAIHGAEWRSQTQAGAVMGTPAYMAPEQAAGQVHLVDARSDVFGLGAILCQILTGQPPYIADDPEEARLKALRWEIDDAYNRLARCQAEPEIVQLCKWCLAYRPAHRPADATVVAQEISRIRHTAEERARQAELQRSQTLVRLQEAKRRRRLLWAMSSIIILVLVIALGLVSWQMQRALQAEQTARANEEQARLAERQAAENLQLALAEREAKEAAWVQEKQAHASARQARDQALEALRLLTHDIVDQQLVKQPELTQQQRAFLQSLVVHYEQLAQVAAGDSEGLVIRAEGYYQAARLRYLLGELDEAELLYRQALEALRRAEPQLSEGSRVQRQAAHIWHNLGILLRRAGRLPEADEAHRQAVAIARQLVSQHPEQSGHYLVLANVLNSLANFLEDQGRSAEAERTYLEAITLLRQVADQHAAPLEVQEHLAMLLNNLANLLDETGRPREALESYRQAIAAIEKLAQMNPQRPDLQQQLGQRCSNLAAVHGKLGEHTQAEAAYRRALATFRLLVNDYPGHAEYRQDLALCLNGYANWLLQRGQWELAESTFTEAAAIYEQYLLKRFPKHLQWRQELAMCYANLGVLCRQRSRLSEAEEYYRKCLDLLHQLARECPDHAGVQKDLGRAHYNMAVCLAARKRLPEARMACTEAVIAYQHLTQTAPRYAEIRSMLGRCWLLLGNIESDLGHMTESLACYIRGVRVLQRVVETAPDDASVQGILADAYSAVGERVSVLGRSDEAEAYLLKSLACARSWNTHQADPGFRAYLIAGILAKLAAVHQRANNWGRAYSYLEQAAEEVHRALQAAPSKAEYRQRYGQVFTAWILTSARLGKHEAALDQARRLENAGWGTGPDAYEAARALAHCLAIIEQEAALAREEKQNIRSSYEREILRLLRKTVDTGLPDRRYLEDDAFAPLFQHPEFIKLRQCLPKAPPDA